MMTGSKLFSLQPKLAVLCGETSSQGESLTLAERGRNRHFQNKITMRRRRGEERRRQ